MAQTTHELLGLDVGMVHTGIARANEAARLAEPLASVKTDSIFEKITELADTRDIIAIVVGLPRSLDGNDTKQTKWVRDWANRAKAQIKTPFYFQDEALTSHLAERGKVDTKYDSHALAAAQILQDFLDSPERQRIKA